MMFLDCPAYLDRDGTARCGLPAEVRCRFVMRSTDGPIECAMIRCPVGHGFNGAIESLVWTDTAGREPGATAAPSRAGRTNLPSTPDGRPNTAPAYYLGRPAALWISAMRPRRRPAAKGTSRSPATQSAAAAQSRRTSDQRRTQ